MNKTISDLLIKFNEDISVYLDDFNRLSKVSIRQVKSKRRGKRRGKIK